MEQDPKSLVKKLVAHAEELKVTTIRAVTKKTLALGNSEHGPFVVGRQAEAPDFISQPDKMSAIRSKRFLPGFEVQTLVEGLTVLLRYSLLMPCLLEIYWIMLSIQFGKRLLTHRME